MNRLPIDLSLKTVTTKVSVNAWKRAQELKDRHNCRLSDIISVCLLHMSDEDIERIIGEQNAAVEKLPKAVRGLLRNLDRLSEEERAMLRTILE